MYVTSLLTIAIHLAKKAQLTFFIAKKMQILSKYLNYLNIFLEKKVLVLSKATKLNQDSIKLLGHQQPTYEPIYSLGSIKLKTLKTYIKINLAKSFIFLSKSFANVFILIVEKSNNSF